MKEKNRKDIKNGPDGQQEDLAQEPSPEITVPAKEYEALKRSAKERDEYYDKYLRAHAEMENAKRRFDRERAEYLKFASSDLLIRLLPIIDSLEIAMRHVKDAKDIGSVREGLVMIQADVQKFLKEIGVERVPSVGTKFDPHRHEAVEFVHTDGEEDMITEELQAGYLLNGKLLRPATVKVSRKEIKKDSSQ